jgi:hypothetical protein
MKTSRFIVNGMVCSSSGDHIFVKCEALQLLCYPASWLIDGLAMTRVRNCPMNGVKEIEKGGILTGADGVCASMKGQG